MRLSLRKSHYQAGDSMYDGPERRKNHRGLCPAHSGIEADIKNIKDSQDRIEGSMENFHTQMRSEIADIKKVATIALETAPEVKKLCDEVEINGNRITKLEVQSAQGRGWLYGITVAVVSVILWILKKTL